MSGPGASLTETALAELKATTGTQERELTQKETSRYSVQQSKGRPSDDGSNWVVCGVQATMALAKIADIYTRQP